MEKKASIIICAYNEENTIENVVRKCREFNPTSEIIIVDDGSKVEKSDMMITQGRFQLTIHKTWYSAFYTS